MSTTASSTSALPAQAAQSWYEASARQRLAALVDPRSFVEFIGPEQREMSPHLTLFDLPEQFDDGLMAGRATLAGKPVLVAAQEGRLSVSGPEVIETNKGIEEFDSRDRALVWRTMGGKHRYLIGGADVFVADDTAAFRQAALTALNTTAHLDLAVLQAEQQRLQHRLDRFGGAKDAVDIWADLGITTPSAVPDLATNDFLRSAAGKRETADDAR